MSETVEEESLVARCLQGDPTAWDRLYRLYAGKIRSVIAWSRWGFTRNEVDDFVQEVFLELVRALPNYRGEANLTTFVMRLARNKCISHLRRVTAQKRGKEAIGYSIEQHTGRDENSPLALAIDKAPPLDEQMIANEEIGSLLKSLDKMSEDCQVIIRLRYYDDLAYQDICARLNLPLGTVCSRLKRCLDRLRSMVEAE